jgi:hypothetical protein
VRHAKTLKKLKLHNCAIKVVEGRERPLCYWADLLVEPEVVFLPDGRYNMPRSVYVGDDDEKYGGYYWRFEGLEGSN